MPDTRIVTAPVIGWREWVALPELGIRWVKAKIDTGARSSSLHAIDLEFFRKRGVEFVRFSVHPLQRDSRTTVTAEAELVEHRYVRSSNGHETLRPVIITPVVVLGIEYDVELTLASRDAMGFRMLLGRQALRDRFLIDTGKSFLSGKPRKRKPRTGRKRDANRKRRPE